MRFTLASLRKDDNMIKQTLEFLSGFPAILSPNAPAKLKKAKLDGRPKDVYKDRYGNNVQVSGLSKDYHLYILGSRLSAVFGSHAQWNRQTLTVSTSLVFQTYPISTEMSIELVLDGTSPYDLPEQLRPHDICRVTAKPIEHGGLPLGMNFIHTDGSVANYLLSLDLLHFIRFPKGHETFTDFKVEYIGIACGPNGNRTVFKRAQAHEKVVEIQGDFQQRFGNRSLFIFAYDPGYLAYSSLPGGLIMTGPELIPRLVEGGKNSLYEAMEASLIAHFQPNYNFEFKNFPITKPKWLNGGIRAFNGPVVDVQTIKVTLMSDSTFNPDGMWSFGRLWTPSCPPASLHCVDVPV